MFNSLAFSSAHLMAAQEKFEVIYIYQRVAASRPLLPSTMTDVLVTLFAQ